MSLNIMQTLKQTSEISAGFRYRIAEIAFDQQKQRCKIDLAQMIIFKSYGKQTIKTKAVALHHRFLST
jgi:hypothetical protein